MDSVILKALIYSRYKIIKDWDMKQIMFYLQMRLPYYSDQTTIMEREYRRFLAIASSVSKNQRMPISNNVNPFWNAHLLFTSDYQKLCRALSIECIHYFPAVVEPDQDGLITEYKTITLPNYIAYFGKPDPNWWPEDTNVIHGFTMGL